MVTKLFKSGIALAVVVFSLGLVGCADKASPDNVDRRSVERWNLLVAHEGEKAYDYLTPGFRVTQTREAYAAAVNNRPVQWKTIKFNRKECDADRCKAYIDVTYTVKLPGVGKPTESSSTQVESWILVNGEWYFLPSN